MKLYVFRVAPNPTRVRLCIAEKRAAGVEIDLPEVLVNLAKGEQRAPEHLARNPLGTLPVLELDDGSFLSESGAIIEYLEELYPEPSLLGAGPLERARNRELERLAELGVLGPVARIVHATKSPLGLPPIPEVAAASRRILPDVLRVLDAGLADGRPFFGGDRPIVADCTLQAALQFARFAEIDLELPERVARWDRNYREREVARSVLVV
ncbi:MAG: glutathione S-transferase family protein [Myxococcales bacterium]|nr:glutathione S-transferase family protein [Myxococcales bacterium]